MKPVFIKSEIKNIVGKPLNPSDFQQIRNKQFLKYSNPNELIKKYEKSSPDKIKLSNFLSSILKLYSIKSLISFGSGESVIEYLIKCNYSSIDISISDFDERLIEHYKNIYKSIFSEYYIIDITKDELDFLSNKYQLALVNAVIYVLDNQKAKLFLENLASANIKYVLIVHTAQLFLISELKKYIIKILRNQPKNRNTFWGWARHKSEIISLAKSTKYKLIKYYVTNCGYKRGIYLFKLKRR